MGKHPLAVWRESNTLTVSLITAVCEDLPWVEPPKAMPLNHLAARRQRSMTIETETVTGTYRGPMDARSALVTSLAMSSWTIRMSFKGRS